MDDTYASSETCHHVVGFYVYHENRPGLSKFGQQRHKLAEIGRNVTTTTVVTFDPQYLNIIDSECFFFMSITNAIYRFSTTSL